MADADTILQMPNTAEKRRQHESIPDRGDDWFVTGFRPIADFDAGTLKVTDGRALIVDGGTLYWVRSSTYTGLTIPGGTSLVHYTVDTSGTRPTGDITIGGSPSEPTLPLARIDADAETVTELNRLPDDTLGTLDIEGVHNVVYVTETADLPNPTSGTHTLADSTAYWFNGFVTSQSGIELGSSTPLVGTHGSLDGFIHTGGATAIQGSDKGLFMRDMYAHAPGGTLFDLDANQSTEMLVESCSFSDAAGLGNIASLGTIDGFRVPTFKGCNFEEYDAGFTFDGTPDKIFFETCPFRNISAAGVQTITLASTLDVDIVDLPGNYGKDWQSDTEFVHVESGGEPSDVLQIRGTTFDGSVTKSNIIAGAQDETSVGVNVQSAWPLADSGPAISYSLDSTTEVTISAQDPGDGSNAVKIGGSTTAFDPVTDRWTHTSPNEATYDGRRDYKATADATVSLSGSNTTAAIYVFKNGSALQRSAVEITTASAGQPRTASLHTRMELTQNDTVDIRVANEGGTGDLTVSTLEVTI